MGKPFTIDAYFKRNNVQNWDDTYFKRKMCKIGRLMLNPSITNTETLNVKSPKKRSKMST